MLPTPYPPSDYSHTGDYEDTGYIKYFCQIYLKSYRKHHMETAHHVLQSVQRQNKHTPYNQWDRWSAIAYSD